MSETTPNIGFLCESCLNIFLDIRSLKSHECNCLTRKVEIKWTPPMTKSLINLYRENQEKFSLPMFKTRQVFDIIATNMKLQGFRNITGEACHIKWRGLKRRYKDIKDKKKRSGEGGVIYFPFFDEMDNLLGNKADTEAVATYNSSHPGPVYRDMADSASSSSQIMSDVSSNIHQPKCAKENKSRRNRKELNYFYEEYFKKIDEIEKRRADDRKRREEAKQKRHEESQKLKEEFLKLLRSKQS